jgi:hypothetical protein
VESLSGFASRRSGSFFERSYEGIPRSLAETMFLERTLVPSRSASHSFGFLSQFLRPRLATLIELAVLETLAKEFRLTEC